jgi:hypothetical protein
VSNLKPPDNFLPLLREELKRFRVDLKREIVDDLSVVIDKIIDKKVSGLAARLIRWEIPQKILPPVLDQYLRPLVTEGLQMLFGTGHDATPLLKDAKPEDGPHT